MTEHSICQPGLPLPNLDSHEGSPSFDFFHKTKSARDFLSSVMLLDVKRSPSPSFKASKSPTASLTNLAYLCLGLILFEKAFTSK